MKTTLNKIKAFEPCKDGWDKLLSSLNKTKADDEELSLLTILESNGLDFALWALQTVDGFEKEIRLMACDFAESVVHLANDERCVNAIKVSRNYANGIATIEELNAAAIGANDAALAVLLALYSPTRTCASTHNAASDAALAAAVGAACAAEGIDWATAGANRAAEKERQISIFKKYVAMSNKKSMKYIKKPIEIDALRFTRNNWDEIKSFTNNKAHTLLIEKRINGIATCIIPTLEGEHIASWGDWIIKGIKGEFYPCKPDIFKMTYEPVIQGGNNENYGNKRIK